MKEKDHRMLLTLCLVKCVNNAALLMSVHVIRQLQSSGHKKWLMNYSEEKLKIQ